MTEAVEMQQIFNEIQTCAAGEISEKLARSVRLLGSSAALAPVLHAVLCSKRAALPPRIVGFTRRLFEELAEQKAAVLVEVFAYLLHFTQSKATRCRQQAMQLLLMILQIRRYDLSTATLQQISERLFDKDAGVRRTALQICLLYQESGLGDRLVMQGVLKDVIRHDQSSDVRRVGVVQLQPGPETLNCLVERCADASAGVRKAFWMACFPRIDVRELSAPQRVFLMQTAFHEREFEAKRHFMRVVDQLGIEGFAECFHCDERVYDEILESYFAISGEEYTLRECTPGLVHMMFVYYRTREERDGRDSLALPDIDALLGDIQTCCAALEDSVAQRADEPAAASVHSQVRVVVGLFRILGFYDLFDELPRKRVLRIVKHLFTQCSASEVVEEAVLLCKRLCASDLTSFIGAAIKKTRGSPLCFAICECVMKHLPHSELHDAIFQEIAIPNLAESIGIIYWYFYLKPSPSLQDLFFSFLPCKKAIEGAADLVAAGHVPAADLELCLRTQMGQFDENAVVPIAKLFLVKKITDPAYLKFLILVYYSTDTEAVQQYLSLYFHHLFSEDASPLIGVFCPVFQLITENYRVFADQALHWVYGSKVKDCAQRLFYEICLFVHNNFDTIKNRRYLFATLERFAISPDWEPVLTRKIVYVFNQIIRKRPSENIHAITARLMEVNDGAPLDMDDFNAVRSLLE
ncbi:hypothetical protein PAPHI01_0035 [Pancytospora philotis]|nr:hypothetical protein PAPHI01_0035 [Pancytospora philotis]